MLCPWGRALTAVITLHLALSPLTRAEDLGSCVENGLRDAVPIGAPTSDEMDEAAGIEKDTEDEVLACGEDDACKDGAFKRALQKYKDIFSMKCLRAQPDMKFALYQRILINETAWIGTWLWNWYKTGEHDPKTIPIEFMLVNLALLPPLYSASCLALTHEGESKPMGFREIYRNPKDFWNYFSTTWKSSAPILITGIGGAVGTQAILDKTWRKKKTSTREYLTTFFMLNFDQLGRGSLVEISFTMPFTKVTLKALGREALAGALGNVKYGKAIWITTETLITAGIKWGDYRFLAWFQQNTEHPQEKAQEFQAYLKKVLSDPKKRKDLEEIQAQQNREKAAEPALGPDEGGKQ